MHASMHAHKHTHTHTHTHERTHTHIHTQSLYPSQSAPHPSPNNHQCRKKQPMERKRYMYVHAALNPFKRVRAALSRHRFTFTFIDQLQHLVIMLCCWFAYLVVRSLPLTGFWTMSASSVFNECCLQAPVSAQSRSILFKESVLRSVSPHINHMMDAV